MLEVQMQFFEECVNVVQVRQIKYGLQSKGYLHLYQDGTLTLDLDTCGMTNVPQH